MTESEVIAVIYQLYLPEGRNAPEVSFHEDMGNACIYYDHLMQVAVSIVVDPLLLASYPRTVVTLILAHEIAHARHPEHFTVESTNYDNEIEADTEGVATSAPVGEAGACRSRR